MTTQHVQQKSIYHGLPVFDENIRGLTAIVTGANGVSGYHMVRVLASSPQRWEKIYCLSRQPPAIGGGLPPNAEFISCDFLKSPADIAKTLKERNVKADHVFFYSYIQAPPKEGGMIWSDVDEMTRLNVALLKNFLGGLEEAAIKPQRIMLQTGGKNYGLHLGPVKVPCEEWDPRVQLEPNFYYTQEDVLWSFCEKHSIGWNIAMPMCVLGAVPDAAMNLCQPLAIYATVCKHLNQPLVFPYDMEAWQKTTFHSSATLNAYLEEWMVLTHSVRNQKLNAVDNSFFSMEAFWPKLAGWYGLEWEAPGVYGDQSSMIERPVGYDPPPRGYGGKGSVKFMFMLTEWAKRPEVQQAWKEIADTHRLVDKDITDPDRVFGFADAMLLGWTIAVSTDKARKLGWHGFVDTSECILEVFDDFAKLKMIPPVSKTKVKFLT